MRSTYSLDIITDTLCKDNGQVDIIRLVLKDTLAIYQWKYQNSSIRAKRDITNELNNALSVVKDHLELLGQYTLIEDLEKAFSDPDTGLRGSNVFTLAQSDIRQRLINSGMTPSVYKNKFAVLMGEAFKEWCKKYPLKEAPAHFDDSFEPSIY